MSTIIDIVLSMPAEFIGALLAVYLYRQTEKRADKRHKELTDASGTHLVESTETGDMRKTVVTEDERWSGPERGAAAELQVDDWRLFLVRANRYFEEHNSDDGTLVIVKEENGTRCAEVVLEVRSNGQHQLFYRKMD